MDYSQELEQVKPFSQVNPMYQASRGEWENERDRIRLEQMVPANMRQIMDYTSELCDSLEYEGSFMFDEMPDRERVRRLCHKIREKSEMAEELPEGLPEALLMKEFERRRCRHRKCTNWW